MNRILREDFQDIFASLEGRSDAFRGKRVFMTGGTGFIGSWLTGALLWANREARLGMRLTLLSRDPEAFKQKRPEIASLGEIEFVKGDVRTFDPAEIEADLVVNGATEASATLNAEAPLLMMDTIVEGARRVSEIKAGRTLFLSSGAVYGKPPAGLRVFREDYEGAPSSLDPAQAYGVAKRLAELYTVCAAKKNGCDAVITRCFAFVGPYLPLDAHFAIGNFIRDGLSGKTIRINGDGKPKRSYMYAADMAKALLLLLIDGKPGDAYNVGSGEAVSIAELGDAVSSAFGAAPVEVLGQSRPTDRNQDYLPDISKIEAEFPEMRNRPLSEAIARTRDYHVEERHVGHH